MVTGRGERVPTARAVSMDVLLLVGLGLLVLASGFGLRDPWPADEPRFALIARDMVSSGEWLFPAVGGDLYQDKPPLFFWFIAAACALTGSLRFSFLLPSLLAGIGTLLLVYDLGRRLWDRGAGLVAALALLFSVQFSMQAHFAQIDALLCFWTTLSLYGLCRHLLLGHGWRWYALGGCAAGLGVITKGVGFLPLLILIPYAIARVRRWPLPRLEPAGWRWALAPAAFVAAISLWLVPMLIASAGDPQLAAYRDEILFQQTVTRYASAWHHEKPFYYLLLVMLGLWQPVISLLPWLVSRWRERWRERDARILLLLGWVGLVLLFFSASAGKRGVYILPALPAFVLATGPWIRGLAQRPDVQRTIFGLALALVVLFGLAYAWLAAIDPGRGQELMQRYGVPTLLPLLLIAIAGAVALRAAGARRPLHAWAGVFTVTWLVAGWWVMPQLDADRSGKRFIVQLERMADPGRELGLLGYKEQFLLHLSRPTVNFGHARWREGDRESFDAARWLAADPERQLLVPGDRLAPCFEDARVRVEVGTTSRERWWLVSEPVDADCIRSGNPTAARRYTPGHR
jgi:4-amino-4-deoxy-L-arabinose transferase-like glycosyltransferase